jgi:hypothetical protein
VVSIPFDWAADSKGLFVSSNPAGLRESLLYVDLTGNAHQIWQVNYVWAELGRSLTQWKVSGNSGANYR